MVMEKHTLSVIIPVNEEKSVKIHYEKIGESIKLRYAYEVIFIDDVH